MAKEFPILKAYEGKDSLMPRIKPLWETDPIQFLIYRRFPRLQFLENESNRTTNPVPDQEYTTLLGEQAAYFKELKALSGKEIAALLAAAKDAYLNEYLSLVETLDGGRFFSEPYMDADIDHWAKISFWTCDEAVALSLGKDPRFVTWANIEEYAATSGFVYVFAQRRELVRRAIEANQLAEKNSPTFFLAWALRTRFLMPDQIVSAVFALGEQVADWKTEYDKLMAYLGEHTAKTEAEKATLVNEQQEAIEIFVSLYSDLTELAQEHENLKSEADELRKFKAERDAQERSAPKSIGSRERSTMLKLIYGMTIAYYGYDPAVSRNQSVTLIQNDLDAKGFKISDDTIRRYLDEAKQIFPFGRGDE